MVSLNIQPSGPRTYSASVGSGASGTRKSIRVPSVTEVLAVCRNDTWMNKVLQKRGRRELERLRDDAATLGVKVHAVAQAVCLDRDHVPEDFEMKPFAQAVGEFLDMHVREVIATEKSLASARLGYGGTMDLVARLHDGSVAVVDWKTTNGSITRVHKMQTAAYGMLLRDAGEDVHRRIVVRLHKADDKLGKWYSRFALDHHEDAEAFKAAVTLWWWLHGSRIKDVDGTPNGEKSA